MSRNHTAYRKHLLNGFSMGSFVQARQALSAPDTMTDNDWKNIKEAIDEVLRPLETDKRCPRCGAMLYLSDLSQYDYVCYACDENF